MQVPGFVIGRITVLVPLLLYAYHVRRNQRVFRPNTSDHAISLHHGSRIGVRRILGYICCVLFFAGLALHLFLYSYYASTRPRHQEPGRTIPLDDHGTVVYLTRQEDGLIWGLFDGALLIGALGGMFSLSASKHP